jgi:1-hydroxycarotenoid 3,4-desaturase
MLVAHVEQAGVWSLAGGMRALPQALAALAQRKGVRLRCDAQVDEIVVANGRAAGVRLASGEHVEADAVVFNGDASALPLGALGGAARRAVRAVPRMERSLSALTWSTVAPAEGFALARHTVFFSGDYAAEFATIGRARRLPDDPTVYVCAQDVADAGAAPTPDAQRLLLLVNAPADGDQPGAFPAEEIDACEQRMLAQLSRCGLRVRMEPGATLRTSPVDFDRLFPATGGALYGRASHGWRASFQRPAAASRIPGLYLAGGSVHPGPGVPMAALSGSLAAQRLLADRASTWRLHPVVMPGGISTR